jgi:hypothetical protein
MKNRRQLSLTEEFVLRLIFTSNVYLIDAHLDEQGAA